MKLRRARPEDAQVVADLARRAYQKWVPVLGREPRPMVADYEAMLEDHRIDLHEVDGAIVASIATKLHETFLFIESVAVDADWQGRGIGSALLAHAEALANEAGLGEIRLLTNAKMEANAALYRRLGYELFETETHEIYGNILHFKKPVPVDLPEQQNIRLAVRSDGDALSKIVRRAFAKWVPLIGAEPRTMRVDYAEAAEAHRIEVVESDGVIVGFIEVKPEADELFIVNVTVDPSAQGQGIGHRLMQRAEAHARELGVGSLRLMTLAVMESNVSLYTRYGYVEYAREHLDGHGTALKMRKALDPA